MIFYISNSGLLLGRASLAGNTWQSSTCLFVPCYKEPYLIQRSVQLVSSKAAQFQQSNIMISIQSSDIFSYVGMIGSAATVCVYTNIQNVKSSVSVNENAEIMYLLYGYTPHQCTIQNSTVQNSYLVQTQFYWRFHRMCQSLVVFGFSSAQQSSVMGRNYSAVQIRMCILISNFQYNGTKHLWAATRKPARSSERYRQVLSWPYLTTKLLTSQ
ncbi:Hypothetical_protein [Hexamita inflata]|uniref:Hypothetical_protein n=1 Tax=Hexamita inflata TaxID=28002 RepID=A0AA86T9C3_9EUKA|nr:Hypothetical protein HINF_LOCUS554 [Hexamita inflata]